MGEHLMSSGLCVRLHRVVVFSLLLGMGVSAMAQSEAVNRMLNDKGCTACHAWDRKLVGPAYNHVRARYEVGDFFSFLVTKVLEGGNGSWGSVYMPAHPQLSKAEGEFLVASIMGMKGYAAPRQTSAPGDDPPTVGRVFRLK